MDAYRRLQKFYNRTIRESLPLKDRTLTDVYVRDTPLFDLTADNPRYKIGLIMAIYEHVSKGDNVEMVGFGQGVTTTHLLWAGASEVVGYEGALNMIETGTKTIVRNYGETAPVTVHHAIVGDPVDIYGDPGGATTVHPSELSGADVLVLDCEGAEVSILSELGAYPTTVICESHPTKGAPAAKIVDILRDRYTVATRKLKPRTNSPEVVVGVLDEGEEAIQTP